MGSRFCGRRFLVGSMLSVLVHLLALSNVLGAGKVADEGFVLERPEVRSGTWWNPQRSGHGIDLHNAGDMLFLVWYTYDPEGLPHWYLAAAPWKGGTWSASLERYRRDAAAGVAHPQTVATVQYLAIAPRCALPGTARYVPWAASNGSF